MPNDQDDLLDEKIDPTQSPAVAGEESASGTTAIPTSDDDMDVLMDETIGDTLDPEETLADKVNEAERERRVGPDEDLDNIPREPGVERLEDLEEPENDEPKDFEE